MVLIGLDYSLILWDSWLNPKIGLTHSLIPGIELGMEERGTVQKFRGMGSRHIIK
ncbi:hypothetical protein EFBL_0501 [Effusibacillus lacus]|uniref:Uncharacterized protein n=1 Tax=Effusibacillus lacus TaxID=1348429 RepID=A0A292YFL4_9BACL|nr:hypothetical protein EDD64_13537 [Effusibacillus lacus]GAX88887.1 hypothetical protein EFBL_0501 [Effusibacillus lacus]